MTTDTDRTFGNQALLTGLFSADIIQDAIGMGEDCIRNDLFIIRIALGGSA